MVCALLLDLSGLVVGAFFLIVGLGLLVWPGVRRFVAHRTSLLVEPVQWETKLEQEPEPEVNPSTVTFEWGTLDGTGRVESCATRHEGETLVAATGRRQEPEFDRLRLVRRRVGPWEPVLSAAEEAATVPEWVTGTNRETGRAFIATSDGGRVDLDVDSLPDLAMALSELYPRRDAWHIRGQVASEWEAGL